MRGYFHGSVGTTTREHSHHDHGRLRGCQKSLLDNVFVEVLQHESENNDDMATSRTLKQEVYEVLEAIMKWRFFYTKLLSRKPFSDIPLHLNYVNMKISILLRQLGLCEIVFTTLVVCRQSFETILAR